MTLTKHYKRYFKNTSFTKTYLIQNESRAVELILWMESHDWLYTFYFSWVWQLSICHKRVKMKSCSFCIMLKVLENKTQIHSSIVALVIQQNNNKVPCFTLYTQLCTKNWGRKTHVLSVLRQSCHFPIYYIILFSHFTSREEKVYIFF